MPKLSGLSLDGFTLIELLVVVAIIALLVAILVPALEEAREQAKAVVCLAHMRAVGQLGQVYTSAYEQWPPYGQPPTPGLYWISDGSTFVGYYYSWMEMFQMGSSIIPDLYDCPTMPTYWASGRTLPPDYPYDEELFTDYGYNRGFAGLAAAKVPRPAYKIVVAETCQAVTGYAYINIGITNYWSWVDEIQTFPHNGGKNAAFADGHAEPHDINWPGWWDEPNTWWAGY